MGPNKTLTVIRNQLGSTLLATINRKLEQISRAVDLFLSSQSDMIFYTEKVGLDRNVRVQVSVSLSPFQYQEKCLLFLPSAPPMQQEATYFDDLAKQIRGMLTAAHGHTLMLFTSYAAMSAVRERLNQGAMPFPLYSMGRNGMHTMERFKGDPRSVLLADGLINAAEKVLDTEAITYSEESTEWNKHKCKRLLKIINSV